MTESEAITVARDHAGSHGLPWGEGSRIYQEQKPGIFRKPLVWQVRSESVTGELHITVDDRRATVSSCRFIPFPRDENGWLLPLWVVFPDYNSVTIGWRMGPGEPYKYRWHGWWRTLTNEQKAAYKAKYPEPTAADLAWDDWYADVADRPASSRKSIGEFINGNV